MIGFLKNNLLLSPFVLFILTFVLRIKGFISPVVYELKGNEGPLYTWMHGIASNPYVESVIVSILIFIQAFLANRLVLNHNLTRPPNFLTAFFFIILASISSNFLGFHPIILANVFIILGVGELFRIYKLHKSAIHIFNAGFLFALAGLIYFPVFIFYFACSIIILVLRSYNIIERLQLLFGFLTPIVMLCMWHYLNDGLTAYWSNYMKLSLSMPRFSGLDSVNSYILTFFGLSILMAILNYRNFIIKKGIEIQKKIDGLYWLMMFALLSIFLAVGLDINHLLLMVLPLSVFVTMFVLQVRQSVIAEFLGLIFLMLVPLFHFILV